MAAGPLVATESGCVVETLEEARSDTVDADLFVWARNGPPGAVPRV